MLVKALVDQPQVDQRLVSDLCQELQGLLAHLGHRERAQLDTEHGAAPELGGRFGLGTARPGNARMDPREADAGLTPRLARSQLWMRREGMMLSSSLWQLSQ